VVKQPAPCGALVHDINLRQPLHGKQIAAIRRAWLDNQVLAFADQQLQIEDW